MEETLRAGLRKAVPVMVGEISDIFESPPPRLSKRAQREMEMEMDRYIKRSVPLIEDLEALEGDPLRLPEAYEKIELLMRLPMDTTRIRLRGKDSFDAYLREFKKRIRLPSDVTRVRHIRRVYKGLQLLIASLAIDPEKEKTRMS